MQHAGPRGRRRYTQWHRARVIAAYPRVKSIAKAAKAAGVSPTWAYHVLERADLIVDRTPKYRAYLIRDAEELYVNERLSCRAVAKRLAERYAPVRTPSQQWVYMHMLEEGVLRTKSNTNRIWQGRRNARDYDDLPDRARKLAEEKRWSVHRIARELGISRATVRRYLPAEERCGPAEATRRAAWEADTPEARARRERKLLAMRLKLQGKTYREISARTGASIPTLSTWFRDEGLTRAQRRKQRGRSTAVHSAPLEATP